MATSALTLPQTPKCTCPPLVNCPTGGGGGLSNSTGTGNNNSSSNDNHWLHCPLCLGKWDSLVRVPMGLSCGHTLCRKCLSLSLSPLPLPMAMPMSSPLSLPMPFTVQNSSVTTPTPTIPNAIPNVALLDWLEFPVGNNSHGHGHGHGHGVGDNNVTLLSSRSTSIKNNLILAPGLGLEPDCITAIYRLCDIAVLMRGNGHFSQSRAVQRKVLNLILALVWNGQNRICRAAKSVGERILVEMTGAISQMSHYTAQQQLWGAIRSRACQFMGPAMQEEALKLVVLALEDGSPLSRKVLVMFVVQRLTPQFPQASKTAIGHIIQLLYRASAFDVLKRAENSSLMTLRPEFRNYEALRREHDAQIVKIALESGIRFSPEQWSSILYGDTNHKPHMQSIIDKLQAPQTFLQMTTEFLVNVQRLSDSEDAAFLLSVHPSFQLLASISVANDNSSQIEASQSQSPTPSYSWSYVAQILEAVQTVLLAWFRFNPKSKGNHHNHSHSGHNNHRGRVIGNSSRQNANARSAGPPLPLARQQNFGPQMGQSMSQSLAQSQFPPLVQQSPFFGHGHGLSLGVGIQVQQPLFSPPPPPPLANYGPIGMNCSVNGNGNGNGNSYENPAQMNSNSNEENQEITKILAESRLLRARIKELQEKNPSAAQELETEAGHLDQDLSLMFQRVGFGSGIGSVSGLNSQSNPNFG